MTGISEELKATGWEVTFRPVTDDQVELVLPEAIVHTLHLRAGQKVHVWAQDGKIFIKPDPWFVDRIWSFVRRMTQAVSLPPSKK